MTRLALTVSLLLLAGPGVAQGEPESKPLQLTVRPSGYEAEANEATERQQKLLRRLEQSNHMIRSICINCGDAWKHQIYAPFNPLASLGRSGQPTEEAGN
ncbi:hypothetical protein [Microvirga sp. CF3016]|uniref:hypothetical protein n=1 Tax=Microvirga sp. CF3016 TaxID=3110181 RepID=UPI002E7A8A3D|nr:hypothetical protein [Microvirga sp. CF3016]MEE1610410.1 hypothetical protein [Microvirga sp. CF3016]